MTVHIVTPSIDDQPPTHWDYDVTAQITLVTEEDPEW